MMSTIEFWIPLQISLMSDYFLISGMMNTGRRNDLRFICDKTFSSKYSNLFHEFGIKTESFSYDETDMFFVFQSKEDEEKIEDYYQDWNLSTRKQYMIISPDIYEGKSNINTHLCSAYFGLIEDFSKNDLQGYIQIPAGPSDSHSNVRDFVVYNDQGMVGTYAGSELFEDPAFYRLDNLR